VRAWCIRNNLPHQLVERMVTCKVPNLRLCSNHRKSVDELQKYYHNTGIWRTWDDRYIPLSSSYCVPVKCSAIPQMLNIRDTVVMKFATTMSSRNVLTPAVGQVVGGSASEIFFLRKIFDQLCRSISWAKHLNEERISNAVQPEVFDSTNTISHLPQFVDDKNVIS